MPDTPINNTYYTHKNIQFRIDTYYSNNKYYCKWYCMGCNNFGETNNHTEENQAKQACKIQAGNHANLHKVPV